MWVTATRRFHYGPDNREIKPGEIFQLVGMKNDGLMLKHGHCKALPEQPKRASDLEYPRCGECGRRFVTATHRDQCGAQHEKDAAALRRRARPRRAMVT